MGRVRKIQVQTSPSLEKSTQLSPGPPFFGGLGLDILRRAQVRLRLGLDFLRRAHKIGAYM